MVFNVFTDGSSLGNPGPGGFCAIVKYDQKKAIVKGGTKATTNNRMEMSAVIAALAWIYKLNKTPEKIIITSDSNLIIQTIKQGWKRKKNLDLWEKLDKIIALFSSNQSNTHNKFPISDQAGCLAGLEATLSGAIISWRWTAGHAGHPENTEADRIARSEAKKRQGSIANS